jgi:hypothetical protein
MTASDMPPTQRRSGSAVASIAPPTQRRRGRLTVSHNANAARQTPEKAREYDRKRRSPEKTTKLDRDKRATRMRRYSRAKKYNLTSEQYHDRVRAQRGKCAICGCTPKRLVVDHEHGSDPVKVRELLCDQCNTTMHAGKTAEHFRAIADYLEKHGG